MNYIPNSMAARDVASLVHVQTNLRRHQQEGPVVIARGEGFRVFDDPAATSRSGGGLVVRSLGFGLRAARQGPYEQMRTLGYYHLLSPIARPEPAIALAEKLLAIAPCRWRASCSSAGSEANDTAIKLAWYYWHAVGQAAALKDHRAQDGLSRQQPAPRQPLGQARHACRLRAAVRAVQAHPISALLSRPPRGRERSFAFSRAWRRRSKR